MSLDLGFISIHYYSICLLLAIIVGGWVIAREGKRFGLTDDFMFDLLFWVVVFGVIGARIYFVIFNFDYYSSNLIEIFEVWKGGLAIHGGIIAGLICAFVYCYRHKVDRVLILDILVVGLIIGQAIGRWGNFFNGEAHGGECSLSFLNSLYIPSFVIDGMYINGSYYIPTFYFESILCLVGFVLLILFRRSKWCHSGQVTGLYLVWYGCVRFFIESFRTDSLMFMSFKMAQIVSIIMVIIGVIMFILCFKRKLYKEMDSYV